MRTLFDKPLAHTNDPITSHEAADRMVESGVLQKQEILVLEKIRKLYSHPASWFTAKSLSRLSGLNYHLIQRRLCGLESNKLILDTGAKSENCRVFCLVGAKKTGGQRSSGGVLNAVNGDDGLACGSQALKGK